MIVGWADEGSPTIDIAYVRVRNLRSPDERSESGIGMPDARSLFDVLAAQGGESLRMHELPENTDPGFAALIRATKAARLFVVTENTEEKRNDRRSG